MTAYNSTTTAFGDLRATEEAVAEQEKGTCIYLSQLNYTTASLYIIISTELLPISYIQIHCFSHVLISLQILERINKWGACIRVSALGFLLNNVYMCELQLAYSLHFSSTVSWARVPLWHTTWGLAERVMTAWAGKEGKTGTRLHTEHKARTDVTAGIFCPKF